MHASRCIDACIVVGVTTEVPLVTQMPTTLSRHQPAIPSDSDPSPGTNHYQSTGVSDEETSAGPFDTEYRNFATHHYVSGASDRCSMSGGRYSLRDLFCCRRVNSGISGGFGKRSRRRRR